PLRLLGARMALSAALLTLALALRGTLRPLFADRALLRDGLLCGGLLALGFVLQTEGLHRTSASRSGFLTGLLVVFVPVLEAALFRKRPPPAALIGIALAFAGMTLLSGPWRAEASATFFGDALTVGCAVVFAGHIIVLGRVTARHPLLPLLWLQLASVAAAALFLGPLVEQQRLATTPQM